MLFATERLATVNLNFLSAPRMERVDNLNLKSQAPGIVALVRPASARRIWPLHSGTKPLSAVSKPASLPPLIWFCYWKRPSVKIATNRCLTAQLPGTNC
jgi:hypothetical protein